MHFGLTEEQKMMQEVAKNFAEKEILPTLVEDEASHKFRPELVRKMGELSFFGCGLPEEYGGNGFGLLESVILAEQIAKVSGSWRLPFNMQNIGPALTVNKFGTEEQKQRFIPGWVSGESIGFFAMTEPNSGSDVARPPIAATIGSSRARRCGFPMPMWAIGVWSMPIPTRA
jgi:glutaryl-CoA dehydrogenase (non-decarboxylating)